MSPPGASSSVPTTSFARTLISTRGTQTGRDGDGLVVDVACLSPSRPESSRTKLCPASSSRRSSRRHAREARNLRNHHLCRTLLHHPDRQLRQRPVRLADDQGDFIAMPNAPRRNDRRATARMKPVPDRDLTRLVVGTMSLLRPRRARSSGVGTWARRGPHRAPAS